MINHSQVEYFPSPENPWIYLLTWPIPSFNNGTMYGYSIRQCEVKSTGGCTRDIHFNVQTSRHGHERVAANLTLSPNSVFRLAIQANNKWGASQLPADWFYLHTIAACKWKI